MNQQFNGKVGKPFEIKYTCELAEPCEDQKGEKWCEKRKKKGKCKKKYYKKCQKTCEQCWSKLELFFKISNFYGQKSGYILCFCFQIHTKFRSCDQ